MSEREPLDDENKERVRRQILSAFADVPMPEYAEIVAPAEEGDVYSERRLQEDLGGKTWENVSPDFFKRRWSLLSCLSAQAFAYYLPALLVAALEHDDPELIGAALFAITPRLSAIYFEDADERFNDQTSLLTPEQEDAVIEFLALFVDPDRPDPAGFRAGLAFRIGWDREDMPDRQPFAGFYHRMYHFEYPEPDDPETAALVAEINAAFDQAPYPGDDNVCLVGGQEEEASLYALEFQGLDWRTLHPSLLAQNFLGLNFFTADGFRYFLPAYLVADLIDLGIPSGADPVFHLTSGFAEFQPDPQAGQGLKTPSSMAPGLSVLTGSGDPTEGMVSDVPQSDMFIFAAERMAGFSRSEREAIIGYLQYKAQTDPDSAAEIGDALDRYWRPSLETAQGSG